jgi:hypothetical protein
MRWMRMLVVVTVLLPVRVGAGEDEGRSIDQRMHKEKAEQAAKKGALKEKQDPTADLKLQKENVKRLRQNAAEDRKAGNRAGAWAAELDARRAERLIKKDQKLVREGKRK